MHQNHANRVAFLCIYFGNIFFSHIDLIMLILKIFIIQRMVIYIYVWFLWFYQRCKYIFVNFMLSASIYCIFRRTNLLNYLNSNVDLIRLFMYTLNHYITYLYVYLFGVKYLKNVFEKPFFQYNTLVQETERVNAFTF